MDAILRALSRRPCAITEEGLHLVLAVVSRDEFFAEVRQHALGGRDEDDLENKAGYSVIDGTAIIPISGPLFAHANMLTKVSGATTYQMINRDLRMAQDDGAVKRILFAVDSPGGDAAGVSAVADAIYDARGGKPMRAFVSNQCASAALWMMSQVDRIDAAETAYVGSIGVLAALIDTSAADEKSGERKVQIVSSRASKKRSYPVDDEVEARVQAKCDEMEAIFIEKVARGRGVSEATVAKKFGEGDQLIAANALAVGLVDGLGSFESVMKDFAASTSASLFPTGAMTMKTQNAAANLKAGDEEKKTDDKPADKKPDAKAEDGAKCDKCDGDGKMPDGSKCTSCDGTGKAKAKAKADDDDDADKKADKKADMEDGDAKSALAKLAGLGASASLTQIASALAARTTSLDTLAERDRTIAELSANVESLMSKSIGESAEAFVDTAVREGRTMADKRDHLITEFGKAERAKAGSGAKTLEPNLYPKGTFTLGKRISDGKGGIIGKAEKQNNFAQAEPDEVLSAVADAAQKIMVRDKVPMAEAQRRALQENPELAAAFKALSR